LERDRNEKKLSIIKISGTNVGGYRSWPGSFSFRDISQPMPGLPSINCQVASLDFVMLSRKILADAQDLGWEINRRDSMGAEILMDAFSQRSSRLCGFSSRPPWLWLG
jgi:hypothetical protein